MLRIVINRDKVLRLNQSLLGLVIAKCRISNLGGPKMVDVAVGKTFANWMYKLVKITRGPITYNGYDIDKTKVKRYEA